MEDKQRIILAMEYVTGGELFDYIAAKKVLSETEARRIFRQVVAAVHYCHEVRYIIFSVFRPTLKPSVAIGRASLWS
jgi:serine/threonine protein kinase